jgi:hypothetical protein
MKRESLIESSAVLRKAYDDVLETFWDLKDDEANDVLLTHDIRRRFRAVLDALDDLIACVEATAIRATK